MWDHLLRLGRTVVRSVGCSVRHRRFHHPSQAGNRHYPSGAPSSARRGQCPGGALTGGRVIFGAGLGLRRSSPPSASQATRRSVLECSTRELTVLDGLWSGEPLTHHGRHHVENVSLAPLQRPRIPIWIGGQSARSTRRPLGRLARARHESRRDADHGQGPERIAEMVAEIQRHRMADTPFEVAVDGYSEPGDPRCRAPMRRPERPGGWRASTVCAVRWRR